MLRAVALIFLCAGVACAAEQLKIERIALHQFEDGPRLESSYEFLPGETAYFSCRFAGYQIDENDEEHRKVKLAWSMDIRDAAGVLLQPAAQGRIDTELFAEDTDWLPKFLRTFVVPAFAPSGEYRISVHARDEVAEADVSGELKFRVKGHAVMPSDTLAIRNFTFLSSEDDKFGMRQPLYKPGDKVWARMDVVGYKFGPGNRFLVAFGMALEGPDGKQIFSEPDAGGESNESFYPQTYAPGTMRVDLDPNTSAGTYTLAVTVQDQVGNQSTELRQQFRVQ